MKKYILLVLFSFLFFLGSFSESIRFNTHTSKHKRKKHRAYNHCPVKRGVDRKLVKGYYYGTASFYHSMFNGRKTSNGEKFNPRKMTGAHKTLRLGTYVEVINLRNKRKVYVKINDRLPPNSCRMIDLTRSAASRLNMIHQGLAKVKLKVIPKALGQRKVMEEMALELKKNPVKKKKVLPVK